MEYISSKKACKQLGLCQKTLQNYAKNNQIDFITTNGGWWKYNVKKFLKDNGYNSIF